VTDLPLSVAPAPLVISWSEVDAWRQCPYKWSLSYYERWTSPLLVSPALARGTLWHQVMEIHYGCLQQGGKLSQALDSVGDFLKVVEAEETDVSLILWMYAGYVQMWAEDDRDWQILGVEGRLELPLVSDIHVKCRLDLVIRDSQGRVWLIDHKTCRNLPSGQELDLDDQFGLYQWLLRKAGRPAFGIFHNAARTQQNQGPMVLTDRFKRSTTVRIDSELDTLAEEILSTALEIRRARAELASGASTNLVTPRHPDPERCRWRCGYTAPCLLGRKTSHERTQRMLVDLDFIQDFKRH
jgi:hypothetical protein